MGRLELFLSPILRELSVFNPFACSLEDLTDMDAFILPDSEFVHNKQRFLGVSIKNNHTNI